MRALMMTIAIAFVVGLMAALMGAAYWLGGLLDAHWYLGASRISNLVILMIVFVMIMATLLTIADRKWGAAMQDRVGPNRARIALPGLRNRALGGVPHLIADAVKMLTKEDFIPPAANRAIFILGPMLAFAPVLALFAVVPAGPSITQTFGGQQVTTDMVVATPDFGLLYLFAIASLAVYGTSLAGWSSNNKFALLGGVRASSQMISYEVALGLSLVGLMLAFSTVQLPALVAGQSEYLWRTDTAFDFGLPKWGFFIQPLGFILFFAAAFAETKRPPFDMPEGESEIIGYFVEYSGMKFGMFMISEYIEVVILAGVITAVFFGGHHLPFGEQWLYSQYFANHPLLWGILGGTVFWVKVLLMVWLQLGVRWTFPRFRYDHVMNLGWKILLPIGLVNVFVSGALVLWDPSLQALGVLGLIELAVIAALTVRTQPAQPHENHGHDLHAAPGHSAAAAAHAPAHGTAGTAEAAPAPAAH